MRNFKDIIIEKLKVSKEYKEEIDFSWYELVKLIYKNDCSVYLLDIRENRKYYENHIDEVEEILRAGCEKSRNLSKRILTDVRNIVGMY